MTTKVTVHPAGHPLVVTITEAAPGATASMTETLEPWAPVQDFHIYGGLVLTVREVPAE